jgi:phage-related protein
MRKHRQIVFYEKHFIDFFQLQSDDVKEKIDYVLYLISVVDRIPEKFFKHIKNVKGLYEIRIEVKSNHYRIFACQDEGKLVILFQAFQKKTQKTPKDEIKKAIKLMNNYHNQKIEAR